MKRLRGYDPRWFILDDDHRPIAVNGLLEWARWLETADRRVAYTELAGGIVYVSTVFLGLDHRYFGRGPPILFETMVFGLTMEDGDMQWRYSSWDDAEAGHKATVKKVEAQLTKAVVKARAKETDK